MSDSPKVPNRRQFLSAAGLMGAGAVLASCTPTMAQTPTKANLDATILNFALNLEYLEAAFYLAAVGRLGELEALEPGNTSAIILPTGAPQKAFAKARDGTGIVFASPAVRAYAVEIANDELAHVKFLRTALAGAAQPRPVLDIGPAFGAAAKAATGADGALAFSPYDADLFFLHGAFIFEDVGVTAYKGAARLIFDDKAGGNLEQAAGILSVEAYHAGQIRTLLYASKDTDTGFGLDVKALIGKISDLRAALGNGKDQGIVNANGTANINPTDSSSIAFSRSPREVANIVFGGVGTTKGLFYPNGLSGDYTAILG